MSRGAIADVSRQMASPLSIESLRALAVRALARMYRPEEQLFVFCVRRIGKEIIAEGLSRRYTAITLLGLAQENEETVASVLLGARLHDVYRRLLVDISKMDNLGDVALTLWAAHAVGYPDRQAAWERLCQLQPTERAHPTVEAAWALMAVCFESGPVVQRMRDSLAQHLMNACGAYTPIFPHHLGERKNDFRSHVSCFADLVYPVQALARYGKLVGSQEALDIAGRCARLFCKHQGIDGQWWWHYDWRTGDVIEGYPVYAVHQDAMAPMALFALMEATEEDFTPAIRKGLEWLAHSPELKGESLIDEEADLIWRKVARREPRKLTRSLQATVSRFHPRLRAPGLNTLFPVGTVDYEDRPYHLGWLLYAWPPARAAQWDKRVC